jgi:hypothetical protein
MSRRYALRDEQWERIESLLPGREGHVGVTAPRQPLICGSGAISLPGGHSLARLAGTLRFLESGAYPVQPLGGKRGLEASVSTLGRGGR